MKEIKISFRVPIYNNKVHLFLTEDVNKTILDYYGIPTNGKYGGMLVFDSHFLNVGEFALILDFNHLTPGVLSHECKHLVNKLYVAKGIELDRYNDEPECYLLQYLVDHIWNLIQKQNTKT